MKLPKAIEILEDPEHRSYFAQHFDIVGAVNLGIEALKRIQVGRNNPGSRWSDTLPGETEE